MRTSFARVSALFANTTHDDMLEFDTEAVFFAERLLHGFENITAAINGFAAPAAYQVMVMSFLLVVIDALFAQLAFIDTAGFFQQVQGTVDGGLIDPGHPGLDVPDNFLSGKVAFGIMDDIHDEPPLGGQFKPFLL